MANDLLASLVIIELDIGRSQNNAGYRATAFLSDSTGRSLGKCECEASSAADLAVKMSQRVLESVKKRPVDSPVNRAQEATRFLAEANFRLGHNNIASALIAAESAYALNPDQQEIQKMLASCLIIRGLDMLDPGKELWWYANYPENPDLSNDDLESALNLFIRAFEMHYRFLKQHEINTINAMTNRDRFLRSLDRYEDWAAANATKMVIENGTPEIKRLYESFRRAHFDIVYQKIEDKALLTEKHPRAFGHYASEVWATFSSFHFMSLFHNSQEYCDVVQRIMDSWIGVAASMSPEYVDARLFEVISSYFSLPIRDQFRRWELTEDEVLKLRKKLVVLEERLNPVAQLLARSTQIAAESKAGKLTPEERLIRVKDLWRQAQQVMDNLDENRSDRNYGLNRRACYDAIDIAFEMGLWWRDSPENFEFWLDFCEQMSGRGDVTYDIAQDIKNQIYHSQQGYPRLICIVEDFLTFLDSPECKDFRLKDVIRTWLFEARETIRKTNPSLVKSEKKVPWNKIHKLIDVDEHEGLQWICMPILRNRIVYALGLRRTGKGFFLEVLRISLDSGAIETMNSMPFDAKGRWDYPNNVIGDVEFYDDSIHVATRNTGIYVFPCDGSPAHQIDKASGLPSNSTGVIACLDGKLYAQAGDATGAYLVAVDLNGNNIRILASSRRKQQLSPFDDSKPFSNRYMISDPKRSKILTMIDSPEPVAGLWEMNPKTEVFHRRAKLYYPYNRGFKWGSSIRNNSILLAGSNWVLRYDLEHDKITWIWGYRFYSSHGSQAKERNLIEGYFNIGYPYLFWDGYLWSADHFSRISIADKKHELFGTLGRSKPREYGSSWCLEVVEDTEEILYGHRYGLWLLSCD
ncbi:MAG: hypothetical protein ACYS8I_03500 [Planctomycetota bacterium]